MATRGAITAPGPGARPTTAATGKEAKPPAELSGVRREVAELGGARREVRSKQVEMRFRRTEVRFRRTEVQLMQVNAVNRATRWRGAEGTGVRRG